MRGFYLRYDVYGENKFKFSMDLLRLIKIDLNFNKLKNAREAKDALNLADQTSDFPFSWMKK